MSMEKYGVEQRYCNECGAPITEEEYRKYKGLCKACYEQHIKEK
jgi:formylmethanofuran dehydrogenase subunit E